MIEWAITSSVLILVVLALRCILMGRISLRLQYGLWALVLVRLLLPVSLGGTSVSILNTVEPTRAQLPNPVVGYLGGDTPQLSTVEPAPPLSEEKQQGQNEQNQAQWQAEMDAAGAETGTPIALGTVLLGIWAVGAVSMGLWLLWVNVRFAGKLRRSRVPLVMENCPPVYVTEVVQTPCLFGLFRPCIYVTEEVAANETVLHHSLAHELTHFRHRDHIWAALRGLCLALHWYNPLVWLAAALSQRDGELCCDEATVKKLGEGERAAYGRTLLAVTCQGRTNPMLTATSMKGSRSGIKERILLLTKRPKTAVYTLVAVVIITATAVGCTFTGAQHEEGELPITLPLTKKPGLQKLVQLAQQIDTTADFTDVKHEEFMGRISGTSFANFLSSRTWEQTKTAEIQGQELILESKITLRDSMGKWQGTLCFWSNAITADYYASVESPDEKNLETAFYSVSERDEQTVSAMTMMNHEEGSLHSELPGGGEMVLVCPGASMGHQNHWLFYTKDGISYTPIDCDLDSQYSRVAECMVFINRDVGFLSFRFEELNGYFAPNLYRTEDGGVTWQRVDLPMGDITTKNGYSRIHVTAIKFENERNGTITVSMYDNSQKDTLSCAFVTNDSGRTWSAISLSGVDVL